MSPGIPIRSDFMAASLYIENAASGFLAELLGIKEPENTLSFGNRGSSLSFSQKINLLIDMGAISNDQKNKFFTFMALRNQFMHNIQAASYEKCVSFVEGSEKFLFKNYPQDENITREEQLKEACSALSMDVSQLILSIIDTINERDGKRVKKDTHNPSEIKSQ